MKKIFFLGFALMSLLGYSQDKIYKNDGSEILSKIIEVNQTDIKYKKSSNLDGPTYTILKNEVVMILYSNGETEVITKKDETKKVIKQQPNAPIDYRRLDRDMRDSSKYKSIYGRNMFSINLFPLLFSDFNISYEHFFAKQKLSFKIPFYVGYSSSGTSIFDYFWNNTYDKTNSYKYYNYNYSSYIDSTSTHVSNVYATGIKLKIYPTGEGVLRGFIEIGGEYGTLFLAKDYYQKTNGVYYKTITEKAGTETFFRGLISGGVSYHPYKMLNLSADCGLNFGTNGDSQKFLMRIGLTCGVRF